MSTATNKGNQVITWRFKAPATAQSFNKVNHHLHKPGVYHWFNRDIGAPLMELVDSTTVRVNPVVAVIQANNRDLSVRVETTTAYDLAVTSSTPYVIMRYSWTDVESNYVDILATDFGSIGSADLIIGRAVYDGSTLLDEFDYTRTSYSAVDTNAEETVTAFPVTPTEPISKSVSVGDGKMRTANGIEVGGNAISPEISDCGAAGRHDIVWIDENGAVQVTEGAAGAAPDYGTKMVVAEIQRNEAATAITGEDIVPVYNRRLNLRANGSEMVGHTDPQLLYSGNTVAAALQALSRSPRSLYDLDSGRLYNGELHFDRLGNTSNYYTILAGEVVRGVHLSPDISTLYMVFQSGVIRAMNLADDTVAWDITLPTAVAIGLSVLSPDGMKLYIENGLGSTSELIEVNTSDGSVGWTTALSYHTIEDIRVSPDGTEIYTIDWDDRYVRQYHAIDGTAGWEVQDDISYYEHETPTLAVSPDSTKVYYSHDAAFLREIDVATGNVNWTGPQVYPNQTSRLMCLQVSVDGSRLFFTVGSNVYVASATDGTLLEPTVDLSGGTPDISTIVERTVLSENGDYLYALTRGWLFKLRTDDLSIVWSHNFVCSDAFSLTVTPNGSAIYFAADAGNIQTPPAGGYPYGEGVIKTTQFGTILYEAT